jgi:hypothetical protein
MSSFDKYKRRRADHTTNQRGVGRRRFFNLPAEYDIEVCWRQVCHA